MNKRRLPRRIPDFPSERAMREYYRNRALTYLELKMRTRTEVLRHLSDWQCPEDLAEEIVLFLEEYKYVDDTNYVRSYIHQERGLHHRSRKDITYRLLEKGVDAELIRQGFDEEAEDQEEDVETAQIRALVDKRSRTDNYADPSKLIAYLQRRGFSYNAIRKVMDEAGLFDSKNLD